MNKKINAQMHNDAFRTAEPQPVGEGDLQLRGEYFTISVIFSLNG
ncbi:hypothetical protein [Parasalinivibrio latis]